MPTLSSTTIGSGSALLKGVASSPNAGSATQVPAGILALPGGTVLKGEITQLDGRGNAVLSTPKGNVALQTDIPIKLGSELALRLTTSNDGVRARILSVNGQSPQEYTEHATNARGKDIHVNDIVQTGKNSSVPVQARAALPLTGNAAAPAVLSNPLPPDAFTLKSTLLTRSADLPQILQQLPPSVSIPSARIEAGATFILKLDPQSIQLPNSSATANSASVPNANITTPLSNAAPAPQAPNIAAAPSSTALPAAAAATLNATPSPAVNVNTTPISITPSISLSPSTIAAPNAAPPSAPLVSSASPTLANMTPTTTAAMVANATATPATAAIAQPTATANASTSTGVITTPIPPIANTALPSATTPAVNTPTPATFDAAVVQAIRTAPTPTSLSTLPTSILNTATPSSATTTSVNSAASSAAAISNVTTQTATSTGATLAAASSASTPASASAATSQTQPMASPLSGATTSTPQVTSQPNATVNSNAPIPPAPFSANAALANGQIAAVVIGHEPSGETVIKTVMGTLKVDLPGAARSTNFPIGTQFSLTLSSILPPPNMANNFGQIAQALPASISELSMNWRSLQEAVQIIAQAQPALAAQILDTVIPKPGAKMASTMLFFFAAMRGNDIKQWLGEDAVKLLEQNQRGDLVRKLSSEISTIRQFFTDSPSPNWQAAFVPVFDGEKWQQAGFFLKKESANTADGEAGGTRFIMEVSLSNLGPMQFDGLIRKRADLTSFDLIIRSQNALNEFDRQNIRDIYAGSAELTGLKGGISFQVATPFPVLPMQQILSDAPDVMA